MTYMPVEVLKPARLRDVRGPAIVLPGPGARAEAFLVTGADPAFACFLTGDHVGSAFEKATAANWTGLAVEGVRFEVDGSSMFKPAFVEQPLGGIVLASGGIELIVSLRGTHGFAEATRITLTDTLPRAADDLEVGFAHWRAILGEGAETQEIFKFEATKTGNF